MSRPARIAAAILACVPAGAAGGCGHASASHAAPPPTADLELTGSAPREVTSPAPIRQVYTVRNLGPAAAADVVVVADGDAGLTGPACHGGDLRRCRIGTLAPGATASIRANFIQPAIYPPPPGTFHSAAHVTSATRDPVPGNDRAALTTVRHPYDGPPLGRPPSRGKGA